MIDHFIKNNDDEQLRTVCTNNIDKPVKIVVYSSKDESVRGLYQI